MLLLVLLQLVIYLVPILQQYVFPYTTRFHWQIGKASKMLMSQSKRDNVA